MLYLTKKFHRRLRILYRKSYTMKYTYVNSKVIVLEADHAQMRRAQPETQPIKAERDNLGKREKHFTSIYNVHCFEFGVCTLYAPT